MREALKMNALKMNVHTYVMQRKKLCMYACVHVFLYKQIDIHASFLQLPVTTPAYICAYVHP